MESTFFHLSEHGVCLSVFLLRLKLINPLLNSLLTCITVYQYSETNVMHFLLNLLRIKGFYMFRALLAHPQLHKRHLVYCMRVMSVGCYQGCSGTGVQLHPW
jgi:hypothetical protein